MSVLLIAKLAEFLDYFYFPHLINIPISLTSLTKFFKLFSLKLEV